MKGSFCCFNRLMVMSISVSIWILSAFITSAVCEDTLSTATANYGPTISAINTTQKQDTLSTAAANYDPTTSTINTTQKEDTLSTAAANYDPTTSAINITPKPDLQQYFTVILGLAGGAVFIIIMVIIIACYCTRCKKRRKPLSLRTDSQKTPSNASMIYRNLIENVNNSSTKNSPTTARSSYDLLQETITDDTENSSETIEKNKKEVKDNIYSKDSTKGDITSAKTESTSGTTEKNKKKIALLPLNIRPKYSSNDLSKENIKSEEIDASNALTEVQSPATPNTPDTPSYEYVNVDPKAEPLGPHNITQSYITVHSDNHENVDPKSQSLELSDNTNEYLTIYTDEQAEAAKKRQGGDKTNYMSPPNQSTKGEESNYYNAESRNGDLVDVYISPANDGYYSNGDPQNTYYNEGQQPNVEYYNTNSKLEPTDADYYNAIDTHDKETSEQPGYYNISETQQNDYYNIEIKAESRPNSDVCEDYDYCDVGKPTSLIKA